MRPEDHSSKTIQSSGRDVAHRVVVDDSATVQIVRKPARVPLDERAIVREAALIHTSIASSFKHSRYPLGAVLDGQV